MRQEIRTKNRVIIVDCHNKRSCEVLEFFLNVLETYKKDIEALMDRCDIPEELDLHFKHGNAKLDGIYHVQKKEVSKFLIVIDIYTGHLRTIKDDQDRQALMGRLLETFLHEILHHKYASEKKADRKAKALVEKILDRI